MKGKLAMKERLAGVIGFERFRRLVGPDWPTLAAQIADEIISDLGMEEVEASKIYPAREGREIEQFVEGSLMDAFAHHVAKETPMELVLERGKATDYPGQSRMAIRGWVITRSRTHD